MNDTIISIVVPVFNVEKYLKDCINSLLNQTYKNIEIILVDDGSTDASCEICDMYAKKNDRIKVYHKQNGGLSSARNYGLDKINGDFVCFLDSDDMYSKNFIENMFNIHKSSKADIIMCRFTRNLDKFLSSNNANTNYTEIDTITCLKNIYYQKDDSLFSVNVNTKMYKSNLFNDTRFAVGRINEDLGVSYKIFSNANKVAYSNEIGYYYRVNENSITTAKVSEKNFDAIYFSEMIYEEVKKHNPELKGAIESMLFRRNVQFYGRIVSSKQKNLYDKLDLLWINIASLRKNIILDYQAPLNNKLCAFISYFGKTIFKLIIKVIY